MRRIFIGTFFVAFFGAAALLAQTDASPYADLKRVYAMVERSLQEMAEQMPEANYGFKPSPEMRTFRELVAHIADTQAMFCSSVPGSARPAPASSKTAKADLVAALRSSSALCESAFDWLNPATAGLPGSGPVKVTKLGVLVYITAHSNEEYGYGAVYLRLKGIVPPSSVSHP